MKITIDTEVLERNNISLGHFFILLMGYYGIIPFEAYGQLLAAGLISENLFNRSAVVLSDNTKDLVIRILTESSPKLNESPVKDFEGLARKLMDIYPKGNKKGTTYPWRGTVEEIAQKLRVLVTEHDFIYTEEEAIKATKQYVGSFKGDRTHMKLLKYFLLRTKDGEISSDFMTIIENNRNENDN